MVSIPNLLGPKKNNSCSGKKLSFRIAYGCTCNPCIFDEHVYSLYWRYLSFYCIKVLLGSDSQIPIALITKALFKLLCKVQQY